MPEQVRNFIANNTASIGIGVLRLLASLVAQDDKSGGGCAQDDLTSRIVVLCPPLRGSGQSSTLPSTPPAAPCWAKLSRPYGLLFGYPIPLRDRPRGRLFDSSVATATSSLTMTG